MYYKAPCNLKQKKIKPRDNNLVPAYISIVNLSSLKFCLALFMCMYLCLLECIVPCLCPSPCKPEGFRVLGNGITGCCELSDTGSKN